MTTFLWENKISQLLGYDFFLCKQTNTCMTV